jgi:hypothetical protein
MTSQTEWPVDPVNLHQYRLEIAAELQLTPDQLPGWCLLEALRWGWREEVDEPPLETPGQAELLMGRRQVWHNQVTGMNCQRMRLLTSGVTHDLAYRPKACGKLTCPGCSIYRQYRYLRAILEAPPGLLVFREVGWWDIEDPIPDDALADWSRPTKGLRHLHLVGWQGSCHLDADDQGQTVSHGRRGIWWSPQPYEKSGAKRLPENKPGGAVYGASSRQATYCEILEGPGDRIKHIQETLESPRYRLSREMFSELDRGDLAMVEAVRSGMLLKQDTVAFPIWRDPT